MPGDMLNVLMLSKMDTGHPRFQVLAREPSREEAAYPASSKYIITDGELRGQRLIRIRNIQRHSGQLVKNIQRIG